MSVTLKRIQALAASKEVRISEHGYEELASDGLMAREVIEGLEAAVLVEDYPDYPKGAAVLVLQRDWQGRPFHAVWGIPKGHPGPAVLITAYRPDPNLWNEEFTRRIR